MTRCPLELPSHCSGSCQVRYLLPAVLTSANYLAASRYLFDDDLKTQPANYQHLYNELKVEAAMLVINSPYAEVRAVVDNHDDPRVPASTFRTWVIGTVLVTVGYVMRDLA